jgi:signal peptidase II
MSAGAAWARALAVAAVVIAADQFTKALVRHNVERGSHDSVFPGLDLVNVRNKGVAFGLFSDGKAPVVLLTGVALAALIVYFALHTGRPGLWLPTGLLLGGALGNILDRVMHDAVTDFLDPPLWPAFNVADISITFGVLALLYVLESPREKQRREEADPSPT